MSNLIIRGHMRFDTLIEAVAHWAENTSDKVCLIEADTDRKMTYAEFWFAIRVFARRLKDAGVQKGDRVVVRVGPLLETFVAQFSIYLVGGVYCPVEKHMKELKLLEMLDYYDSTLFISTERIDSEHTFIDLSSVCDDGDILTEVTFPNPDDMCAIVFTTGTTGDAKGVMLSYKAYLIGSMALSEAYEITEKDIFCWVAPIDKSGGIRLFCVALVVGCTAVHYDSAIFVNGFFNTLYRYGVTAIVLQSFMLNIILKSAPDAFGRYRDQIRTIIFGGGNVSGKQKSQMQALLPNTRLFAHYNATEVSAISYYEFSRYPEKENCVGKPFPCSNIYIMDEEGNTIGKGSKENPGAIVHEGLCGMIGYWKDAGLTSKVKSNGRIIMTDIGYIGDDNFLYILGRSDDVIVSGGHKIAPYEVESIASQIVGVSECLCVPLSNDTVGVVPQLIVQMEDGVEFSAKKIYDFLAMRLETYKLPRVIREVDDFPRVSGSQKIDRKAFVKHE